MTRTERIALYGLRHPWRLVVWWLVAWFVLAAVFRLGMVTPTYATRWRGSAYPLGADAWLAHVLHACELSTPLLWGVFLGGAVLVVEWFRPRNSVVPTAAGVVLVVFGLPVATTCAWFLVSALAVKPPRPVQSFAIEFWSLMSPGFFGDGSGAAIKVLATAEGLWHQCFTMLVAAVAMLRMLLFRPLRSGSVVGGLAIASAPFIAIPLAIVGLINLTAGVDVGAFFVLTLLALPVVFCGLLWLLCAWSLADAPARIELALIRVLAILVPTALVLGVLDVSTVARVAVVAPVLTLGGWLLGVLLPVRLARTVRSMTPVPDDHPSRDWAGAPT